MSRPIVRSREEVAGELERLAEISGDDAFRRAARVLFQDRPGRDAFDDADALAEVGSLFRDGVATTVWGACCLAARSRVSRDQVRATAERLRRKYVAAKKCASQ